MGYWAQIGSLSIGLLLKLLILLLRPLILCLWCREDCIRLRFWMERTISICSNQISMSLGLSCLNVGFLLILASKFNPIWPSILMYSKLFTLNNCPMLLRCVWLVVLRIDPIFQNLDSTWKRNWIWMIFPMPTKTEMMGSHSCNQIYKISQILRSRLLDNKNKANSLILIYSGKLLVLILGERLLIKPTELSMIEQGRSSLDLIIKINRDITKSRMFKSHLMKAIMNKEILIDIVEVEIELDLLKSEKQEGKFPINQNNLILPLMSKYLRVYMDRRCMLFQIQSKIKKCWKQTEKFSLKRVRM